MDLDRFSLFLKMLLSEYPLDQEGIDKISVRLLADEEEFSKTWGHFQNREIVDGVDSFKPVLEDLLL
ncbi:MAG TPA: hypothetical protein VKZ84_05865 [Bacteriovoracaceae bacterium]|nr:hypothetical protein [Bacteriovoracaceae bacterium]